MSKQMKTPELTDFITDLLGRYDLSVVDDNQCEDFYSKPLSADDVVTSIKKGDDAEICLYSPNSDYDGSEYIGQISFDNVWCDELQAKVTEINDYSDHPDITDVVKYQIRLKV